MQHKPFRPRFYDYEHFFHHPRLDFFSHTASDVFRSSELSHLMDFFAPLFHSPSAVCSGDELNVVYRVLAVRWCFHYGPLFGRSLCIF